MSFQFKSELLEEVLDGYHASSPTYFEDIFRAGRRFFIDAAWGMQEKHNGDRRTFLRDGNTFISLNREGNPSKPVAPSVIAVLLSHPIQKFVIDVELVGTQIVVLDALVLGDELLGGETYEYREARAHAEFDNFHKTVVVVETARTTEEKIRLFKQLLDNNAEGVVIRKMDAAYKMGSREQHKKIKFWKELDAIVIGPSPSGHNSVRVGLINEKNQLQEICGVSLNGKEVVSRGMVIKVKYLYATKERHVVQPELLGSRDDKQAVECTMAQIKYRVHKNWR